MKKTKLVVLGLTSMLALTGCNKDSKKPSESQAESDSQSESIDRSVKSVTLNKHEITLEEEGAESLVATILPENALNKKLNWSSSNEDVAMVSGLGKVRALSAGTAIITVSSDEDETIKDTCTVRVNAKDRTVHVESVSLNKETLTIEKGDIEVLTATVLPNNATDKSVTWNSDNTSVATVENGVVTAVSKGKANITVSTTDGAKTATCEVTVTDSYVAVESVTISGADINEGNISLKLGERITSKLTATVLPETASNKKITWESSDETKVTVSQTGQVTAIAETSEAVTITAKSEADPTKKDTVTVTVAAAEIVDPTVHVTSISLGADAEFDIAHETSTVLTAAITPSNAADRVVTFEIIEGADVVALGQSYGDNSREVTFLKTGTATIRATSHEDTSITDEITLTITDSVNHITALAFDSSMPDVQLKGDTLALSNYINVTTQSGEAATNPTLVYASSNTSVATVTASGQLTALHAGTTTLTVTSVQDPSVPAAEFELTVKNVPVESVSLNENALTLDVNETFKLEATVIGVDDRPVDDTTVTWEVIGESAEGVATVSSTGLVTAKKQGTATIRATSVKANADDEVKTASCTLTVRDSDTRIIGLRKQATFTSFESEKENLDDSYAQEGFTQNDSVNKGTFFEYENADADKALYKVGDQGAFQFAPIAQARDKDNQEKSYNLTDYVYTLEKRDTDGSYVAVSESEKADYVSYEDGGFYDFKPAAIGNVFRLNVRPNPDSADFIVPKTMVDFVQSSIELEVVEGYNAYSLAELSLFDNKQSFWNTVRENNTAINGDALPSSVNGGIILHKDISVLSTLLPAEMILDQAAVDVFTADAVDFSDWCKAMGFVNQQGSEFVPDEAAGKDALLNSPYDYTTVFLRNTGGNQPEFKVEGNFFRLDSSSMKQIAALNSHSATDKETLMKGYNGDGSHAQLFGLNIDGTADKPTYTADQKSTVALNNIQITGNSLPNTSVLNINRNKGGYIIVKSGRANLEVENAIVDHAFIGFMTEIHNDADRTAPTTDPQEYSSASFDRIKCYECYSDAFYMFGSKYNEISNSWLGRCGGPVFLMDEPSVGAVDVTATTPVYGSQVVASNVYMNNPVSGTEPWFVSHPGSNSMIKNYMVDAGNPNADPILDGDSKPVTPGGWIGKTAAYLGTQTLPAGASPRTITQKDPSEAAAHLVNFLVLDMCIGGFGGSGYASPQLNGWFILHNEGETTVLRSDNGMSTGAAITDLAAYGVDSLPALPGFIDYGTMGPYADAAYRATMIQASSNTGFKTYYPENNANATALLNTNYLAFYLAAQAGSGTFNRFGTLLGTYDMTSWAA